MSAHRRVLVMGTTGINKRNAIERLSNWLLQFSGQTWRQIDFEQDYLFQPSKGGLRQNSFLNASLALQAKQWRESWTRMVSETGMSAQTSEQNIFLSLHGVYVRGHYGSRCTLDINAVVNDFQPDLIVTFIADVYDMWWRTEHRAQGEAWRGRPSIEQIISARRHELIIGDMISQAKVPPIRNLMLAVGHPCDTLGHCILHPEPRIVYLSFPISEPRKMEAMGDSSGMEEVSAFIRQAYQYQKANPSLVLECPLAIDEIPFLRSVPVSTPGSEEEQEQGRQRQKIPDGQVEFDRAKLRWDLGKFWPISERISAPASEPQVLFPSTQVRDVHGGILADVTFRDYRLVDQADRLAVFNPVFNNRLEMAGSVRQEINFAIAQDKPVYIYQDPQHDSHGIMNQFFTQLTNSTMAPAPSGDLTIRQNTIEEMLAAVTA